ncbi:S8 family serine peptidase [Haloarcula sp. 1CSR25-25]|uniref:S8 family serine peptidase n=1 Tax=Haloarcula sp. 1CSR25-25 TaxID=2862545 RepID=UPI002893EB85|nr:S8 family serine peptidase [Haloarcula sp. 1CSR25-25]MDT3434451.1 S8 family serine peptidase [Haloarcula sp. 1CSR25-25]
MVNREMHRRTLLFGLGAAGVGTLTVGSGRARAGQPDRHIVGTRTRAATDAARRQADSVHRVLDFDDIGQAVAGRFADEALDNLERNPNVRYIERDDEMRAISIDSDDSEVPWGIDRVDAEKAHADGATGSGADVAVIDTGIDSDHPDLRDNLGTGKAVAEASGSAAEPWDDDNGHGTHCAGIADAVDNSEGVVGVSTSATLHAVKVLDGDGSGTYSDVAAGLEWVADQRHDVGSLSLGGPKSSTIEDACQYAYDKGVLLVAAAGNDGNDVEETAPATYSTVMAVTATDETDSLASFSNYGSDVELAAPGVDIVSTYPGGGYETFSGTSMACPHVSGASGQLMADGDSHTDARKRLTDTAEDLGLSSSEQGSGLLDVEAAVGGSTDTAPSVSWVAPSSGETVSGTVTVQLDASDSEDGEDALDVTYTVDGGSSRSAAYNATTGYYEDAWDTTAVADGDHSLEASATDSAGNTTTATVTVTTERAPTVDSLSAGEVETSTDAAEFDVDWQVSDDDGDLATVDLSLTDDTTDGSEDSASVSVGGDTVTDTTRLVAAGDDAAGHSYTVDLVVTDSAGQTASDSTTVSETESTDSAPSIETFSVSNGNRKNPHAEITVDWSVGDADGDLDTVTVIVDDVDETETFSTARDVSGSSASGTESVTDKRDSGDYNVTLTVTDAAGNVTSSTKTLTV